MSDAQAVAEAQFKEIWLLETHRAWFDEPIVWLPYDNVYSSKEAAEADAKDIFSRYPDRKWRVTKFVRAE